MHPYINDRGCVCGFIANSHTLHTYCNTHCNTHRIFVAPEHLRMHIHTSDVTNSHVWHDSLTSATWLIHMRDMNPSYLCDLTQSSVRHDSFPCVPWLHHLRDVTHYCVYVTSWLICVSDLRFTHLCNTPHFSVYLDSFNYVRWLIIVSM